jgi:P-type conjugative transfer ATPase TrbB
MMNDGKTSTRDEQTRRIAESMKRQLGAFCPLLRERGVVELMLNADGRLWVDRLGQPMAAVGKMPASTAESFIATVASTLRSAVTRENPIIECELPQEPPFDGSRFEALIPPVVSAPVFSIRRKASAVFTLLEYERQGIMTGGQREAIERAVAERRNILVVGGTTTGKTTLTNAIIDQMVRVTPDHRLLIIEDTAEIQCAAPNAVVMRATDTVDMQRLLKATLRLRPDRIIVGEVRGGEALAMLKAWNTGHPGGVCTVHANHARAGLIRVEQMIAEVSQTPMRALIAEAVNLIVSIVRIDAAPGRRIHEVVAVNGFGDGDYRFVNLEQPE